MIWPMRFPAARCARCGSPVEAEDAVAVEVLGEDGRLIDAMAHEDVEVCKEVLSPQRAEQ